MSNASAVGTLLLIGVAFLSLNALAVSARPGEAMAAEKATIAASAVAVVTASGPAEPAGTPVSVPVPPPTLNPVMGTSGWTTWTQPTVTTYLDTPTVAPGQGITPPAVSAQGIAGPVPGEGIVQPSISSAVNSTWSTEVGILPPGVSPTPVPPITPVPGRMSPGVAPPYSVAPVHEGL